MNTPTPRTDAAWAKTFEDDEDQCRAGNAASDMREECATLERELAALAAERDQLRAALALGQQNCDDAYDEWIAVKAERDQLRAENATLRAAQKACEACDEPTAFEVRQLRARAERAEADAAAYLKRADSFRKIGDEAEAELTTERAKVKLREVWLCGRTELIDCGSGQRHASDFVTFDEAEAKKHVAKYKLSWMTEGWYRAVPVRAPVAIDAAMKEEAK